MSKINFLTIAVVLLLLLNAGTLLFVFRWHAGDSSQGHGNGEGPSAFIIQALQLDARQQEQFAGLRRDHQQKARALHEEDKRLHDAYFSLLKTEHPDRARVDSIASLIGDMEKQLSSITFEHFEKLRALCRDDQKKRFDATIDEIARRMAPGPKRPGGPPPPGQDGAPPDDGSPSRGGSPPGEPPRDGPPQ